MIKESKVNNISKYLKIDDELSQNKVKFIKIQLNSQETEYLKYEMSH